MKIKWNISGGIINNDIIHYYLDKYNLTEKYNITVYDSYFFSWCGGREQTIIYNKKSFEKIVSEFNAKGVGFNITFSNHLITKEQLENPLGREQLDILAAGKNNGVVVASPLMRNFLRKNYPNLKVIQSVLKSIYDDVIYKKKEEDIVDYYNAKAKMYDAVVIKPELNERFNILEKIEDKEKFELFVNQTCIPYCELAKKHYTGCVNFINDNPPYQDKRGCIYLKDHASELIISLETFERLKEMGFCNFKMIGRAINKNFFNSHFMKFILL